jgi:hypothetical protein
VILLVATAIVLVSAAGTAVNASDRLTRSTIEQAVRGAEAVVRGYVDPHVGSDAMHDPTGPLGAEANAELERLVGTAGLLRIKVWAPDGTILFSDLPALRGRALRTG